MRTPLCADGAVAAVLAGAALLAGAPAAVAHPFGEPQSVELSADGTTVTLLWSAAPDDLLALGGAVGALPERRTVVFDVSPSGDPEPVGQTDADRITNSPAVEQYLLDHVAVYQDGQACPARVSLAGLVETGGEMTFACPETVSTVTVEITMLTDLHEAYRTVAVGERSNPDRALYTIDSPAHPWSFEPGSGHAAAAPIIWLAGGALAAVLLGAGAARMLSRSAAGRR